MVKRDHISRGNVAGCHPMNGSGERKRRNEKKKQTKRGTTWSQQIVTGLWKLKHPQILETIPQTNRGSSKKYDSSPSPLIKWSTWFHPFALKRTADPLTLPHESASEIKSRAIDRGHGQVTREHKILLPKTERSSWSREHENACPRF